MSDAMDYARIASLYDVYVRANFDIPFFLKEAGKIKGQVLELMSGTGRVSLPLVEEGVNLTCVDNSLEMLEILAAKLENVGLNAQVYQMDVRELNLPALFDLAIIPFHSFSELLTEIDQRKALASVYRHLVEYGTFICTLQNPAVRIQRIDGQIRLWGKYPLLDPQGTLLMWGMETYNPASDLVAGLQTFELYDARNIMRSKRFSEYRFTLIDRDEFEELVIAEGFKVIALYGDYSYSNFDEQTSPYMVWVLQK